MSKKRKSRKQDRPVISPGVPKSSAYKWILPTFVGAAVTLDGPGNVIVKTFVLFGCSLWLCVDFWFLFSGPSLKLNLWRNLVFCSACTFVLTMASTISWWLVSQRFNEDQKLAFTGLVATAVTPPDVSPMEATFSVTNGSEHNLGKHSFRCGVKLISFNNGVGLDTEFSALTSDYDGQLDGGGDKQTYQCLGLMAMPRERVDCLDIVLHMEYVLVGQPNTPQVKEFRFTANRRDGFLWTGQPLTDPTSFCMPYLTEESKAKVLQNDARIANLKR